MKLGIALLLAATVALGLMVDRGSSPAPQETERSYQDAASF